MKLHKYISLPIFLSALAIGIFLVYISGPEDRRIYVYPTLENIDQFLWKDGSGTCFGWDAKEVAKPTKVEDIKIIPVQN